MKHSITLVTSVALLMCLITTYSNGAERKFEKKFSVSPGGTLTLTADVGDVDLAGTSSNEVSIVADLRGPERDIEDFEISAWQDDKGVQVKGKSKHSRWFSWFDDGLDVRFIVKLPREYNVQVTTSGGDIKVSGLKGRVQGETSGGDLHLSDVEGAVKLETSGGNIRTEKVVGDVYMETSGGDIQLLAISGNVDVSTSGGDIRISDINGTVRAETSGGDVVVKVKSDNKGIHAETSGGNIDIVVPKGITANIDASTSGGEVICDLPVTMSGRFDESRIRGTVNGGGAPIRARTSGGNVRIKIAE